MLEAKIHFKSALQGVQEYKTGDEFMISQVFFDLEIDTRWYRNLSVSLKQVTGSDFDEGAIEVSAPEGYAGPINQNAFQQLVRDYYMRSFNLKGGPGSLFKIENSQNIIMKNNRVTRHETAEFTVDTPSGGW